MKLRIVTVIIILTLGGLYLFWRKSSSQYAPVSEVKSLPETVTVKKPTLDVLSLEELQDRLAQVLPNLLASSKKNDEIDYGLFWTAFVNWLGEQKDIPEKTRQKFRRVLRMELGMGPEE